MATVPAIEDTERAILDAISTYNVRPNQIVVKVVAIQLKLFPDFTADEFKAGLGSMIGKGWIEITSSGFIKITDAGFSAM